MIYVYPTIDTEGVHGDKPFEQFILGEVGEKEDWGTFRLARIFKEFAVSATFFVDCYEYTYWGESKMEKLCQDLIRHNQDVQLHTHPSWRDDPRDFKWLREMKKVKSYMPQQYDMMSKLSLEQQIEVLEHGKELLEKWIGETPVAHRSGGYSINMDTVKALKKTGIKIDSSMNVSHSNSKITWSSNSVVEKEGVLEIPVTVFNRCFGILGKPLYRKLMKTDIDDCSVDDLLKYVEYAEKKGLKFLNLFFHSYSLLNFNADFTKITADSIDDQKLRELLRRLKENPNVEFVNSKDILQKYNENHEVFSSQDSIPDILSNSEVIRLAKAKVKRNFFGVMRN